VCSSDVIAFQDPYVHLTDRKFWTDSAFHKGVHLPDGAYYITVQALNGAELGGSLVLTLCHSTPLIVDTTSPVFDKVTDIIYDEDFDLIAIYYSANDPLSKIAHAEFGLGKTKYDVQLKPYGLHAPMEREDPFVAVEDLGLVEGVPAWIRIRVTNNGQLYFSKKSNINSITYFLLDAMCNILLIFSISPLFYRHTMYNLYCSGVVHSWPQ